MPMPSRGLLPIGSLAAGIFAEMMNLRPTLAVGAVYGLGIPILTMRDYPHQENSSIAQQILDV